MIKRFATAVLLVSLSACSSNPNQHKPSPLAVLPSKAEQVNLKRQWKTTVGAGLADDVVKLRTASQTTTQYAVSRDGVVLAVDEQGKKIWQQKTKLAITGGVSAAYGIVVIGSAKGDVVAFNALNGTELWRKKVLAAVLAPAAISADSVIVQSNDGKVYGLHPQTGDKIWVYDTPVPSLSLRGYATPLIVDDVVIVATATGKIVALETKTGIGRWESRIAVSEGRSELARLIDVDSDMLLSNDKLYVASYQGQLAALEIADKPTPLWQLPVSSFQSLAQGLGNVYVVDAGSTIIAVDQVSGKVVWKQSDFAWRGLSNAVTLGDYLIVGDNKGYIHLMAQSNGKLLGRKKVSDAVIQLSVNQQALMVYTAKGQWSRWQLPAL